MSEASGEHHHPVDPERVARARARLPSAGQLAPLVDILGLIAETTRARVLYALDVTEELCVGDLALALHASENAVGYALRLLRTAGLVSTRKQGRVVYYRLADGFPAPLRQHCLRELAQLSAARAQDE